MEGDNIGGEGDINFREEDYMERTDGKKIISIKMLAHKEDDFFGKTFRRLKRGKDIEKDSKEERQEWMKESEEKEENMEFWGGD